jgi:hypothetical protein
VGTNTLVREKSLETMSGRDGSGGGEVLVVVLNEWVARPWWKERKEERKKEHMGQLLLYR